jgi:hypothetical protein
MLELLFSKVVLITCLKFPHNKGISTADFWNKGVDWIFDTFFVYIKAFNTWLIQDVLQPMRALYLRMPAGSYFSISCWSRVFDWRNSFSFSSLCFDFIYCL